MESDYFPSISVMILPDDREKFRQTDPVAYPEYHPECSRMIFIVKMLHFVQHDSEYVISPGVR